MPTQHPSRRVLLSASLAILATVTALSSSTRLVGESVHSSTEWAYVLLTPGSQGADMSGSMDDVRQAKSLRTGNEGLLYVRQGRSAYVVRDPAIIRKAESFFKPQEALGVRQTELGNRQTELGRQQTRLGDEQAAVSNRERNASPSEQAALARQQQALGAQQDELGRRQDALGKQQEVLGREQERVARIADEQVQKLFEDALRSGLAQRIE